MLALLSSAHSSRAATPSPRSPFNPNIFPRFNIRTLAGNTVFALVCFQSVARSCAPFAFSNSSPLKCLRTLAAKNGGTPPPFHFGNEPSTSDRSLAPVFHFLFSVLPSAVFCCVLLYSSCISLYFPYGRRHFPPVFIDLRAPYRKTPRGVPPHHSISARIPQLSRSLCAHFSIIYSYAHQSPLTSSRGTVLWQALHTPTEPVCVNL